MQGLRISDKTGRGLAAAEAYGSQNTLGTPYSGHVHTPDTTAHSSLIGEPIETAGAKDLGLEKAGVGGGGGGGGEGEGGGGGGGGERKGGRRGGGGKGNGQERRGGEGRVDLGKESQELPKPLSQVKQTPNSDNHKLSRDSEGLPTGSQSQSGKRRRQNLETLTQAATRVRSSGDPHSPIWIEGQSYPAQYLVRQTRSMSLNQIDMKTSLWKISGGNLDGRMEVLGGRGFRPGNKKGGKSFHAIEEQSIVEDQNRAESGIVQNSPRYCQEPERLASTVCPGIENPYLIEPVSAALEPGGLEPGGEELHVRVTEELHDTNNRQARAVEAVKNVSTPPGDSHGNLSLTVSIPVAQSSPCIRVSGAPLRNPFLSFTRPPSLQQCIPQVSTDFFLPDEGFQSLKLEKLRSAQEERLPRGDRKKSPKKGEPHTHDLGKPGSSHHDFPCSHDLESRGGEEPTSLLGDSKRLSSSNVTIPSQSGSVNTPLLCTYTELRGVGASESIKLQHRSSLQLPKAVCEVHTYIRTYVHVYKHGTGFLAILEGYRTIHHSTHTILVHVRDCVQSSTKEYP